MIAIIDYGVGNLFSLRSSLETIGAETVVTGDPDVIKKADKLLLPGVGAFADAAKKLRENGLDRLIVEEAQNGKPLLGICLGMQLLFDKSYEYGEHQGLGLIPGAVLPFEGVLPKQYKIPHIGWNALQIMQKSPLFTHVAQGEHVYFVHSYHAACEDVADIAALSEYGMRFTAAVARGNVMGCQFHPEKSGKTGLNILRGFCETEAK